MASIRSTPQNPLIALDPLPFDDWDEGTGFRVGSSVGFKVGFGVGLKVGVVVVLSLHVMVVAQLQMPASPTAPLNIRPNGQVCHEVMTPFVQPTY